MASLEQPDEPRVQIYPPDEGLRRARPLPGRSDLVVEGIPDEEWTAFLEALADA